MFPDPHPAALALQARDAAAEPVFNLPLAAAPQRPARGMQAQGESAFRTLAENSPDIIARLDRELRHLYINRAAETAFGRKVADFIGCTPEEAGLPPEVTQACAAAIRQAEAAGQEHRFAFCRESDGRLHHYSGRAIPEFGDEHAPAQSVLVIVYDVTQRAEAEQEREALLARAEAAREQAEAAAHARDQFLAIVSHELRSPLNGIQSWAHVLEQQAGSRPPVFARALTGIRRGVEQQVRLIEDLLDATRVVSGQLRLAKHPFALLPVIETALESVRASAAAKQVLISTKFELSTEQVYGDSDRVQQLVWNLLDNAVKFVAPGGHVRIGARRQGASAVITVIDDGKGISPEFLPQLFDRFRQADASTTRRHEGLGLGLALVRHLVKLHGGDVTAESPGRGLGSTFRVTLPLRHLQSASGSMRRNDEDADAFLPSLAGLRLLVVDDQEDARDALCALLANAGAEIFSAQSGRDALAQLERMGPQGRPDALVCDIAMPEEDGYQTLRNVRAWEAAQGVPHAARMPAIALTAFAQREDRIRALSCGFAMQLTKPVAPAELLVVVATQVGKARAREASS